jgi:hypothetical protein
VAVGSSVGGGTVGGSVGGSVGDSVAGGSVGSSVADGSAVGGSVAVAVGGGAIVGASVAVKVGRGVDVAGGRFGSSFSLSVGVSRGRKVAVPVLVGRETSVESRVRVIVPMGVAVRLGPVTGRRI